MRGESMCYVIESDNFLANVFFLRNRHQIAVSELKEIRRAVENELPNVYVDISPFSLVKTMELFPNAFQWEGRYIRRVGADRLFLSRKRVDEKFNWRLPRKIKQRYLHVLRKSR